jgi:hypothetical protein
MAPNGVGSVGRTEGRLDKEWTSTTTFDKRHGWKGKSEPPTYELGVEVVVRASLLLPAFLTG